VEELGLEDISISEKQKEHQEQHLTDDIASVPLIEKEISNFQSFET
jgi:hypothetical protein